MLENHAQLPVDHQTKFFNESSPTWPIPQRLLRKHLNSENR